MNDKTYVRYVPFHRKPAFGPFPIHNLNLGSNLAIGPSKDGERETKIDCKIMTYDTSLARGSEEFKKRHEVRK